MIKAKTNSSVHRKDGCTSVRNRVKISFGKAQRISPFKAPVLSASRAKVRLAAQKRLAAKSHAHAPSSADPDSPLAKALEFVGTIKSRSGVDLTEKVKELITLAREEGY